MEAFTAHVIQTNQLKATDIDSTGWRLELRKDFVYPLEDMTSDSIFFVFEQVEEVMSQESLPPSPAKNRLASFRQRYLNDMNSSTAFVRR